MYDTVTLLPGGGGGDDNDFENDSSVFVMTMMTHRGAVPTSGQEKEKERE